MAEGMADLDEAKRWLLQGAMDLETAEDNVDSHPYAACFFSQQAAEKAAKAFMLAEAGQFQRTHDILSTLKASPALRQVIQLRDASLLDAFYISTRYPDAWPGGVPAERFTAEQAREAVASASGILAVCGKLIASLEAAAGQ